MIKKLSMRIALIFLCFTAIGCATNRSEVSLPSPIIQSANTTQDRAIFIRHIKDERVFQQAPKDPSIPSLGFGGVAEATEEVKARAIGRKRNSYGMALGDVLLQKDKNVESVIRENLAAAFSQAGYQVLDSGSDNLSPLTVDVSIKEFWAWFRPGFWALTLSTNIVTDLKFSDAESPVTIEIHAQDSRQMATDKAWVEIVEKALEQYRLETGNIMKKPDVLVERPR